MAQHWDYSRWRPTSPAWLKEQGVVAVGRYLGWDGQPGFESTGKNLTPTELEGLQKAGVGVWLTFEYANDAAASGAPQGAADAWLAAEQLGALGLKDICVYFAVDFDIPDYAPSSSDAREKLGPVADYFAAILASKPAYQVGVYGGYWAVSRVLSAGLAQRAWQTVAWSGGQLDARADIYQTGLMTEGKNVDLNDIMAPDFGQWPEPAEKRRTIVKLASKVMDGKESIRELTRANPGNAVATVFRLTAENSPHGIYRGGMGTYLDLGNWNAPLPKGDLVYYYERVPVAA